MGSLLKLKQYAHRDREAAGNLPSFHRHVRAPAYIMHPPFTCQPFLPYTASLPRWLLLQLCLPLRGSLLPSMPYMVNPLLHVNIRYHGNFENSPFTNPHMAISYSNNWYGRLYSKQTNPVVNTTYPYKGHANTSQLA